jgi:acyltransferase
VAIAISIGLVLLAESVVPRLGERAGRGAIVLAGSGTMVILTHAVVLFALGTPAGGSWPDFAIAVLLPWGAALTIARTPLAPFLIGSPVLRPKLTQLSPLA